MRWRLAAAIAVTIVASVSVFALYEGSEQIIRPNKYRPGTPGGRLPNIPSETAESLRLPPGPHDPMTDYGLPFEEVSFPTEGGAILRGWYVPGAPGAALGVITVHGAWNDRREYLHRLPFLHSAGYPVLLFDCREHGVSDGSGRGPSFGVRESGDASAAAHFAHQRGWSRVVGLGDSQGAAALIEAAAESAEIDGVIAENAFARFDDLAISDGPISSVYFRGVLAVIRWRTQEDKHPQPIDVIGRIGPRPVLLMHGTADSLISPDHTLRLLAAATPPKEAWLVPNSEHGEIFFDAPAEYRRRVLAFLTVVAQR